MNLPPARDADHNLQIVISRPCSIAYSASAVKPEPPHLSNGSDNVVVFCAFYKMWGMPIIRRPGRPVRVGVCAAAAVYRALHDQGVRRGTGRREVGVPGRAKLMSCAPRNLPLFANSGRLWTSQKCVCEGTLFYDHLERICRVRGRQSPCDIIRQICFMRAERLRGLSLVIISEKSQGGDGFAGWFASGARGGGNMVYSTI